MCAKGGPVGENTLFVISESVLIKLDLDEWVIGIPVVIMC